LPRGLGLISIVTAVVSLSLVIRRLVVVLAAALTVAATAQPARADRPSTGELDKRIAAAAHQLEVIVEQYDESRDDLSATRAQAATLGRELTPMTHDVDARRRIIGGLATRTYERTRTGPAMALLAAPAPHEFVQRLLILDQLAAEQQRAVAAYTRTRSRIDDARHRLQVLAVQQRREQIRLATRKATVEAEIATLRRMREAAYGNGSRFSDDIPAVAPPYVPGAAGRVVAFVFGQLGKPYRWGADGPGSYDCSGLALAAWRAAGVPLPHNAARQYGATTHLSRADLRPGDLVFYYGRISHVGVYIGHGMMIHAPEYGEDVRTAPIDFQPIHGFGRPR
jgi:cell wall-associated NlpC family hydrolase